MADKRISRRKFIRDSAVAAAGIVAGLGTVVTQTAQAAHEEVLHRLPWRTSAERT